MVDEARIRKSINQNVNLWIALWILLLLNLFMIITLGKGFSILALVLILIAAMAGTGVLKYLAEDVAPKFNKISSLHQQKASELMQELKPLCDDIFAREISRITEPVIEEYRKDITRGLSWLWEDEDEFVKQVEQGSEETRSMLQLITNLSEDKFKIVKNLNEDLSLLDNLLDQIRRSKERDYDELERCLTERADRLKADMEKEKSIFYDYINKLLIERIKDEENIEDISEYFNVYKLGEQFSAVMGKSLEMRLTGFQDSLVDELENLSANIVGRMQKSSLQLTNAFNHMEELINQLATVCRGESGVLLRRMGQTQERITALKEQAGEKLVTLAWQEILIEKRWHDIKEKLFSIRDQVNENIAEDVIEYIRGLLAEEITEFDSILNSPEDAVLYKSLVDAECVYRVYTGNNLPEIVSDGVYSLLQFVRPVELIIMRDLQFSQEGLQRRKNIKEQIKAAQFQEVFDRVKQVTENYDSALGKYLNDIFPGAFLGFCNNPYVKQRTDNLNQAAWMVFMDLIDDHNQADDIYCLVGLLLIIHKLRNSHIQPLKNAPVPLNDMDELENMRACCYKTISILLTTRLRGVAKLK